MLEGLWDTAAGMDVGVSIKEWRERLRMTQKQLAEAVGVHEFTISRIERDVQQPRRALYRRIVEALTNRERELTQLGLEGSQPDTVGSASTSQINTRRSADSSASSIAPPAVTGSVSPPSDDVLTEDEIAMLTPSEQSILRRFRQSSPHDQERIDQMIDVIRGDVAGKTTGTAGDDALHRRFRGRTGS